MGFSPNLGYLG